METIKKEECKKPNISVLKERREKTCSCTAEVLGEVVVEGCVLMREISVGFFSANYLPYIKPMPPNTSYCFIVHVQMAKEFLGHYYYGQINS